MGDYKFASYEYKNRFGFLVFVPKLQGKKNIWLGLQYINIRADFSWFFRPFTIFLGLMSTKIGFLKF